MPVIAAERSDPVGKDELAVTLDGQFHVITDASPVLEGETVVPQGSHVLVMPDRAPIAAWVDQNDVVHFGQSSVTIEKPDLLTSDPTGTLSNFAAYLALPDEAVTTALNDIGQVLGPVDTTPPPVDDGSIPVDDGTDLPPVTAPDDTGTTPPDDTTTVPPTDGTGTPPDTTVPPPVDTTGGPDDGSIPPVEPPTTTTTDPTTAGLVELSGDFARMVLHVGQHADQPTLLSDASELVTDAVSVFAQLLPHVDTNPDVESAAKALSDAFAHFIDIATTFPASGVSGAPGTPATGGSGSGSTPSVPPVVADDEGNHGGSHGGWHGCGGWQGDHGSMVSAIATSH